MGKALYSGGWKVDYPLGEVNLSNEFQFPLQLIYMTGRTQEGLFGSQWFCPQLESSILPAGQGYLIWTMPSGGQVAFGEDESRKGEYRSADKAWRAKVSSGKQTLRDAEGWQYEYAKGRLQAVRSPGRRVLEFEWKGRQLIGVQLRDLASGARQLIFHALYNEDKRLSSFKLLGQLHKFAYIKDGTQERLAAWSPPVGEVVKFLYQPGSGILACIGIGNTEDEARIEKLKTVFVNPKGEGTLADEFDAKKYLGNYWLIQDALGKYNYKPLGKKKLQWNPADVTLTAFSGLVQESNFAEKRGIVTSKQGEMERKNYYFRSPGQKYDGKLRRIEENGKLITEYRYSRKTGLLTEIVDATGKSTFFDYDPKFRPSKRVDWEPKPIRVRYGTRRKFELRAEYAYNDEGKLIAAKDASGNLTQYTYSARGELATVTNPAGDKVSYTYDGFGRVNSVTRADTVAKVDYDEAGRIKSQTAPDGTLTEMKYDADGLVTKIIRNGKVTKELVRDEFKRVIGEKDGLQRFSRRERDIRGNLLSETAANGAVTRYEYDSMNRRTAQIDGNGNKITFAYDLAGNLVKQTNALNKGQTWNYDPKTGKLLERTNGEQTIRQSYDPQGQLTSIDYGNSQKLEIGYDEKGRQVSVVGPDTSFTSTYDPEGRLTAAQATHGEDEYLLSFRYNRRGQRTGLLISQMTPAAPSSVGTPATAAGYEVLQQTDQTYDSTGNLNGIFTNGIPAIRYRHDMVGRPIQKVYGLPDQGRPALTADIGYSSMGHLARIEFNGGALTSPLILDYVWDDADQLSSRTWNGQTLRYEYDPSGQLLKVIDADRDDLLEAYTYDRAGNMLTKSLNGQLTTMTYNVANQLATSTTDGSPAITYTYDDAGRMLGPVGIPPKQYGWLDKLTVANQANGPPQIYQYWPDGHIASIRSEDLTVLSSSIPLPNSASSESFLWDGLALIKRNDILYLIEPHPSGGIPIASHPVGRPDEITYHLNDLLGTTLATVGPAGVKFAQLTSFGQPLKASTSGSSFSTDAPSSPINPVPSNNQLPPTKR